jgi:hypothetical protein
MAIPLKAKRSFVYAGRRLHAGDPFDARTTTDARILVAIGHAGDPPPPEQYSTRVMTPGRSGVTTKAEDLDSMDIEALRTLAAERGVRVHHFAGAERIRAAIREAQS